MYTGCPGLKVDTFAIHAFELFQLTHYRSIDGWTPRFTVAEGWEWPQALLQAFEQIRLELLTISGEGKGK